MSSPVDPRVAFQQGYMRAAYRLMDLIHKAFRQHWDAAKTEAALRRALSEQNLEAETEAFIEANLMREGAKDVIHP